MLPSSEASWPLAAAALRRKPAAGGGGVAGGVAGGWLHVHENVREDQIPQFCARLVATIKRLLDTADDAAGGACGDAADTGKEWLVRCPHLEKVKWYAPRVRHVVADVECRRVPVGSG